MGSCAAPSAKGDDKFITTDYLQQCPYAPSHFNTPFWIEVRSYPASHHLLPNLSHRLPTSTHRRFKGFPLRPTFCFTRS
ncbi:hypothetical protein E6P06_03350 (plasmid) [Citrobacter sp. CF971]|nr:hypothetical protein E6P06_03350 [Citrobacter sp. CF971]